MQDIQFYILRVCATGILCSIAFVLLGNKGIISTLGKFVAGLVLACTVAAPFAQFQFEQITDHLDGLHFQANSFSQAGQSMAKEELSAVIKSRVEEYIRDEASLLGVDLQVTASISTDNEFCIHEITLSGPVSPLHRQRLQEMMSRDLGVPKERLKWKN